MRVACRPRCPGISPGIALFVSGMYRDNRRQTAPIIEHREAMRERRTNAAHGASSKATVNGCFILEKRTVAHPGRCALRRPRIASRGPSDGAPAPRRARIESNRAISVFARRRDRHRGAAGCAYRQRRHAFDSSVKIPTGSSVERQRERATKNGFSSSQHDLHPPAYP